MDQLDHERGLIGPGQAGVDIQTGGSGFQLGYGVLRTMSNLLSFSSALKGLAAEWG
jgi:hypothetical protein